MPGTTSDDLPSVGFIARYLADAAKQQLPARGVATVLQAYVDRGVPYEWVPRAVALARDEVPREFHPFLAQYAEHLAGPTPG